jgi:hypothetical protein
MGFGGALLAMWQGHNVGRVAWRQGGDPTTRALAIIRLGATPGRDAIISFSLGSDTYREWAPSSMDLLASDWIKYEQIQ